MRSIRSIVLPVAATLLFGVSLCHDARAATVRPRISVDGTRVHLSDLFSDVPPTNDADLGDAPPLGGSFDIGAAQLQAIAAQYGIDWSNDGHLAHAVVTRASRLVTREDMATVMAGVLHDRGTPDSARVMVAPFPDTLVPIGFTGPPTVRSLDVSGLGGSRFQATLEFPGDTTPIVLRLTGTIDIPARAVELRHAVQSGDAITPDNVVMADCLSRDLPKDAVLAPGDMDGMIARRPIAAGQPLTRTSMERPHVIHKGAPVILIYTADNLRITASGVALEDAGTGDPIHVANPGSHVMMLGTVIDRGQVEIQPGSIPTPMNDRGAFTVANHHAQL
ncbi:flagellar basal body P-ring biosynthesis protein FlgA [Ameyamaea chiangmaiensis NBRC 103196]|uniref:Flagellar basal body P-ring formation protein FlgA n=1 Tax=Ameyamaea chiangmaiensis TaxID=442969 RepID=A0A850P3P2_9PROT|nr:flagellar basal body P-ring formation chaperone FlgA [Ameyamaea chiangmaiensis]MBS4075852.1 flagellar basal body P-ring formation protein FlgA [Ameyamaea chiangmaiensis]NVN39277.1 flagellar basal body P-ring formation protein FlgA [Ameyamaea chiangmaiensis]GBQ63979.1 flagellar basal body P-ring biosynthesis protein FlgA [Ameyamaea chiangmaiensis NBRC 103196]